MSAADSLYERQGAFSLPFSGTSLTAIDPGRNKLLALFAAAINAELATPWSDATAGHQLFAGTSPVQDTLALEPNASLMQQRKAGYPLLCLHRFGTGAHEPHTMYEERVTQPWLLHYILGPLAIDSWAVLGDMCTAVWKIVGRVVAKRGHPAYESGALQFFGSLDTDRPGTVAEFGSIRVVNHEGPGVARFADDDKNSSYYAVTVQLETIEYGAQDPEGSPVLEGADYNFGIGGSEAGVIGGLLYADTDAPRS